MKNLLMTCLCVTFLTNVFGQYILEEDFIFSGFVNGTNGWITSSGVSNFVQTTTPGLVFANYPGSGVGNAVAVNGIAGEDVYKRIPQQTKLYYSFLIKVVATDGTKRTDYISALGKEQNAGVNGTLNGNYFARVIIQTLGNGTWKLGTSNWAVTSSVTAPIYSNKVYNHNQTYAVVVSFNMNDNYKVQMWVLENKFIFNEVDAGIPDVVFSNAPNTAALPKSIDAICLRQDAKSPSVIMDALRVFDNWGSFVLPLTLVSFKAHLNQSQNAQLEWTTTQSFNVKSFTIEKSIDGHTFQPIATIPCTNQVEERSYSYADNNTIANDIFYRLRIIDLNGSIKLSDVIHISNSSKAQLQIGTLGGKVIKVMYPNNTLSGTLKIIDLNGTVRKTIQITNGALHSQIHLQELPVGIYVIRLENGKMVYNQKFFLQ